jgi:tetratricopeptide (TPR) repeat protein
VEERAQALKHARLAIDFGANDPNALWMAAHVIAFCGGGNEQGLRIVERSLALNRNSAQAWSVSGFVNWYLGNGKIAVDHFKRAIRLSPADPLGHTFKCGVAFAYFAEGQYEEAVNWADMALSEQPRFLPSLRIKAAASALLGRIKDAQATARLLLAAAPDLTLRDVPNKYSRPSSSFAYIDGLRKAGVPEG